MEERSYRLTLREVDSRDGTLRNQRIVVVRIAPEGLDELAQTLRMPVENWHHLQNSPENFVVDAKLILRSAGWQHSRFELIGSPECLDEPSWATALTELIVRLGKRLNLGDIREV